MHALVKLFLALAPLLLTGLLTWLLMEGHLNFGGGEKDIFLAAPLLVWSLVYMCSSLVLWWRRFATGRALRVSAGVATGVVAAALVVLFGVSWFKFG